MHYFVQGLGLGLGLGILVSVSVSVSNCKSLGLEGMVSVSKELVSVLVSVSNVLVSVSVSDIKVSTTTLVSTSLRMVFLGLAFSQGNSTLSASDLVTYCI